MAEVQRMDLSKLVVVKYLTFYDPKEKKGKERVNPIDWP